MSAITVIDDVSQVNEAVCIGCGACTSTCPTEAIRLSLRQEVKPPPQAHEFAVARLK